MSLAHEPRVTSHEPRTTKHEPRIWIHAVSVGEVQVAGQLMRLGITAFWNFTGKELSESEAEGVIMENVHLGDSLMILNYRLCQRTLGEENEKKKKGRSTRSPSRKRQI